MRRQEINYIGGLLPVGLVWFTVFSRISVCISQRCVSKDRFPAARNQPGLTDEGMDHLFCQADALLRMSSEDLILYPAAASNSNLLLKLEKTQYHVVSCRWKGDSTALQDKYILMAGSVSISGAQLLHRLNIHSLERK